MAGPRGWASCRARSTLAALAPSSGAARHPHLRGGRPFSCCAGEGLDQMVSQIGVQPSLLPFTGEGARRADEGARAQRSVLLTFAPGARKATATRCARALIRRFAPPSPAPQEKGWFRKARQGPDGEALLPFTGEGARRADEGARAQRSVLLTFAPGARKATAARCARALIRRCAPPSPASQEKGWTGRRRKLGEALLPLRRRRAGPGGAANWG